MLQFSEILREKVAENVLHNLEYDVRAHLRLAGCDIRDAAHLGCWAYTLSYVDGLSASVDASYGFVIEKLRERLESDPTISLEVNNIQQYFNKPARYKKYFRYMTLITQLEAARYQILSELHAIRAQLLAQ